MIEDRYTQSSIDTFKKIYKCSVTQTGRSQMYSIDTMVAYTDDRPHYYRVQNTEVEISMTNYEFQRLATETSRASHYRYEYETIRYDLLRMTAAQTSETEKRNKNPAAQKAYEKYLMLLNMTADGN